MEIQGMESNLPQSRQVDQQAENQSCRTAFFNRLILLKAQAVPLVSQFRSLHRIVIESHPLA
jgi:hypothetical protein